MNFLGVIVNSVGIFLGGLVGHRFGEWIPEKIGETLISALALCVLFIGMSGVTLDGNLIIAILSISVGAIVGEGIDFDRRISDFGTKLQQRLSGRSSKKEGEGQSFGESFVATSLIVSMGAMSIVGSLESGMRGDPSTLLTKAVIDTVFILVMSSTMGIGCAFSAIPLFFYQGGLTLLSGLIAPYMTDFIITQMSYIGSILIIAVGLNMLELTRIRVGNLILAPFLPMILIIF